MSVPCIQHPSSCKHTSETLEGKSVYVKTLLCLFSKLHFILKTYGDDSEVCNNNLTKMFDCYFAFTIRTIVDYINCLSHEKSLRAKLQRVCAEKHKYYNIVVYILEQQAKGYSFDEIINYLKKNYFLPKFENKKKRWIETIFINKFSNTELFQKTYCSVINIINYLTEMDDSVKEIFDDSCIINFSVFETFHAIIKHINKLRKFYSKLKNDFGQIDIFVSSIKC